MKLLRPLPGYTLYDHKTNDYIRRELRTTGILDKIDEYRRNWLYTCKECHKNESIWNHTTTDHKDGEQLEDRRSVGASSCNSGDGTHQKVQFFMFMMMMTMIFETSVVHSLHFHSSKYPNNPGTNSITFIR